jgi:hypothetical protein
MGAISTLVMTMFDLANGRLGVDDVAAVMGIGQRRIYRLSR